MKAGIVFLSLLLSAGLLLGGCGSSTPLTEVTGPVDGPGNGSGGGNGNGEPPPPEPTPISEITDEEAILLTRSVMAMSGRFALIGDIAAEMVRSGAGLLDGPFEQRMAIPECADSPAGTDNETNEFRYWNVSAGDFGLPPGNALTAAFTDCVINGFELSGFLHIAAINRSGDLSGSNWSLTATVAMSPIEIVNGNQTVTSFTDDFNFSASRAGNVLTVTMEADQEPNEGPLGGVNAQHHLSPAMNNQYAVNYQFRPFRSVIVDDDDSGEYRVSIEPHSTDGTSRLERYTSTPPGEINVTVATAGLLPITWAGGKPQSYLERPDSGEVSLVDGSRSLVAAVDGEAVTLTLTIDGAVTAETMDWEELLTAPES